MVIASLGYFYNSNHHTLSAFLGEPMMSPPALAHWRDVIQQTVLRAVAVPGAVPDADVAPPAAPRKPARGRRAAAG
ncbi:HTH-type transcriptional repressor NicS [compost metagenome]